MTGAPDDPSRPCRPRGGGAGLPAVVLALLVSGAGASGPAREGRATEAGAAPGMAEACAACHGADGNSADPTVPSLAGQPRLFLYYQLIQFREGRRKDPRMTPVAADLSHEEMRALAEHFSTRQPKAPAGQPDPAKMAAGRRVADRHHCGDCHARGYVGQDHVARLAGQHEAYLLGQLRGFKAQTRADIDGAMTSVAQALSDADIEQLAHYLSHLTP